MPSERIRPVSGILLAAGTSSRMGCNKLLLQIAGESLLHRSARRALEAGVAPLVVVLGYEAERAAAELAGLGCRTVINPDYENGITSSLHAGITALPGETGAVVVMLADMPHVGPEMIAALISRYRNDRVSLVISDYEGVDAPPMLYDRSLFSELLTMTGGGCGRQVVKRHRGDAVSLAWPIAALADLDVPEDYERFSTESAQIPP